MSEILELSYQEKLFFALRENLVSYKPWYANRNTIICPLCNRDCTLDEMSLEHILGQKTAEGDPSYSKVVPKNNRTQLSLLCKKQHFKGGKLAQNGCNGWKGSRFDPLVKQLVHGNSYVIAFDAIVAARLAAYIAAFQKFGYGIIFNNNDFHQKMVEQFVQPRRSKTDLCSILLVGEQPDQKYDWAKPFTFSVSDNGMMVATVRNIACLLPIPNIPHMLSLHPASPLDSSLKSIPIFPNWIQIVS